MRPCSSLSILDGPRRNSLLPIQTVTSWSWLDAGKSWKSIGGAQWAKRKGEVAWTRGLGGMYPAEMMFDPVAPAKLWFAQGVGVASAGAVGTPYQLSDWSAGIEELCAVHAITVPGGKTFLSAWDKSFWRIDDYTTYSNDFRYPVAKGTKHNPGLVAYGSYMDFAGDDPRFMVGVVAPSSEAAPGFTANGGDSWQALPGRRQVAGAKGDALLPPPSRISFFCHPTTARGFSPWTGVRAGRRSSLMEAIRPVGSQTRST